jgi:predicted nucleotidyltransferase
VRERHPNLIVPIGTQVAKRVEIVPSGGGTPLPKGIVGELIKTPDDSTHVYRVRFPDGAEGNLRRHEFSLLKHVKTGPLGDRDRVLKEFDLHEFVIYRCIVGSRACGLSHKESDVDRREHLSADAQWELFEKEQPRREVEANLVRLNEEFRLSGISELVSRKSSGTEQSILSDADVDAHRREYDRLRSELEVASERSHQPEAPSARAALSDLLVRLRRTTYDHAARRQHS